MDNIFEILMGFKKEIDFIDLSKEIPPEKGICECEDIVGELSDDLKKFFCALRSRALKLESESREVDAIVALVKNGDGTDAEKEIVQNHLLAHELVVIMTTLFGYEIRSKFSGIVSEPRVRIGEGWKVIVGRRCEGCSLLEIDLISFDLS